MEQNEDSDSKWMADRIFTPYMSELIIEKFQEHTGYSVSETQKIELRNFLYDWSLECVGDVINAD